MDYLNQIWIYSVFFICSFLDFNYIYNKCASILFFFFLLYLNSIHIFKWIIVSICYLWTYTGRLLCLVWSKHCIYIFDLITFHTILTCRMNYTIITMTSILAINKTVNKKVFLLFFYSKEWNHLSNIIEINPL